MINQCALSMQAREATDGSGKDCSSVDVGNLFISMSLSFPLCKTRIIELQRGAVGGLHKSKKMDTSSAVRGMVLSPWFALLRPGMWTHPGDRDTSSFSMFWVPR